jgi:hypothetical protein
MRKFLKRLGLAVLVLVIIASILYLLPKGPRDLMAFDDPYHQARSMVVAEEYVVAAGTSWATQRSMCWNRAAMPDAAAAPLLMHRQAPCAAMSGVGQRPKPRRLICSAMQAHHVSA